eukprot:scaffold3122_cov83-Skeletonema_marinoi.AAC.1
MGVGYVFCSPLFMNPCWRLGDSNNTRELKNMTVLRRAAKENEMSISKQPIACAFPDGQFNTGSLGRRRNIRINGAIAATLLVLAILSSDQTAAAANLRSRAPESGRDNSHSHTQQQNKRSLEVPSFNCPPHHIGYYPTTDCFSYYWWI